jgi:hypothetical protein
VAEIHVSTRQLQPDDRVVTSEVVGTDFGLPVVEPTTRAVRRRTVRTVRSVVGGVVRFTDGTKTHKLHGRTSWVLERESPE